MKLVINLSDRPHLMKYIKADKVKGKEFLTGWLGCADKLVEMGKPVQLIEDTADQLQIDQAHMLAGIIAGCLNEQYVNERLAPILGKELLPIAILTLKGTTLEGQEAYFDWRRFFHLKESAQIDAETIAKIIGGIMKYARFLDFDKLSEALESNQLIAFKGLADQQVKLLPFYPALQYQKDHMGSEFKVGKFMPEHNAGFFDCGYIDPTETHCPACGRRDLTRSKDNKHIYCRACNAGYYPKEGDAE
jgi:hypothetical protein